MKREIPILNFYGDDYFHFKNCSKTKVTIYIHEKEASLTLSNELGSCTWCNGNINLVFREYMKNWNESPLNIQIVIVGKEANMFEDIDGDFLYTGQHIAGKFVKGNEK